MELPKAALDRLADQKPLQPIESFATEDGKTVRLYSKHGRLYRIGIRRARSGLKDKAPRPVG